MNTEGSYVEEKPKDCMSCRLIRCVGCLGIGSYLIFEGRRMKGYSKGTLFIFGGCFSVIGMASLLGFDLNKMKFN